MQEALEREGTPEPEDLERRVNRMAGTMESIARNLAVVDEAVRGTDRRLENIVSGLDSLINVIPECLSQDLLLPLGDHILRRCQRV